MTQRCDMTISDLLDVYDSSSGVYAGVNPLQMRRFKEHLAQCSDCQHHISAIDNLDALSDTYFSASTSVSESSRISSLLNSVTVAKRQSRDLPNSTASDIHTEDDLRALVRRKVSNADMMVTRVHFYGDISTAGTPIRVSIRLVIRFGIPIATAAKTARMHTRAALKELTRINVTSIDVEVTDVLKTEAFPYTQER